MLGYSVPRSQHRWLIVSAVRFMMLSGEQTYRWTIMGQWELQWHTSSCCWCHGDQFLQSYFQLYLLLLRWILWSSAGTGLFYMGNPHIYPLWCLFRLVVSAQTYIFRFSLPFTERLTSIRKQFWLVIAWIVIYSMPTGKDTVFFHSSWLYDAMHGLVPFLIQ